MLATLNSIFVDAFDYLQKSARQSTFSKRSVFEDAALSYTLVGSLAAVSIPYRASLAAILICTENPKRANPNRV